jgi:hypothetical protein
MLRGNAAMITRRRLPQTVVLATTLISALSATLVPMRAPAATLGLAGTLTGLPGDDNDEIDRWRSTSVVKTFDLDHDNVYGTAGYVMFGADDVGNANPGVVQVGTAYNPFTYVNGTRRTVASIPGYLAFNVVTPTATGIASSYGYKQMDDPSLAPAATVANLESGALLANAAFGTEVSLFDIVIGAGAPAGTLRLGLFYGNTDAYNGLFRIQQIVGSGSTSVSAAQTLAAPLEMSFFDIGGAAQGDTFRVFATKNAGSTGNANVLLGGVTVDVIPEPASASALLLGAATLLGRARRRRAA